MSIKKHIPNAITCGNLVSGCLSLLFIGSGMPVKAALMILVASLFDFLDGLAARALNAHSPIGADLDSLSDVVSFGVAPGLIMCYIMYNAPDAPMVPVLNINLMTCLAFLLPVFAAVRLARFNVDDTQKTGFRGLPTPAMALFVASLQLALAQMGHARNGVLGFWACLGITLIFSFMMVSNLRCFSFKVKSVGWKGNEVRWIFLVAAVVSLVLFRWVALPFIIMLYILLSVFFAGGMEQGRG